MEIIFSRILSVPIGGPPNGILVAPNKFANHWNANRDWSFRNLVGATKIPFGGPPMGTFRIREKIISIEMGCFVILYNWGFEPFSVLFLSFRAIGVFYNWVCMHMESCNKSRSKKSLCKRIQIITVRNVSVADIHFNHTTNRDRIKIKKILHDP